MKRILIAGAHSYIGTSFERYLQRWPARYQVDTVDMKNDAWKEKNFKKYDVIFHVAGIAHSDIGRLSEEESSLYYLVNTDLTVEAAQKAKAEKVRQFIFMSSSIVYGGSAPIGKEKVITKETPISPSNVYGDSKVQAEKGILPLQSEEFHVVVLRPPLIYGRGCKGNYALLDKLARITPIFPSINNARSMLYIDNLCEFVRLMIENNESGIFWPQNDAYLSTTQLVQEIAECTGKKILFTSLLNPFVHLAGKLSGVVKKAFGNFSYDMSISAYREPYQIVDLKKSIQYTSGGENEK